jgi:hypothetical protein
LYQCIDTKIRRGREVAEVADVIGWILIGLVVGALVVLGFRSAGESPIQKWEKTYGVALDVADEAVVGRRLTRVRRVRSIGAIVGFMGVSFLRPGDPSEAPIWLQPLFGAVAGYLAAAVLTEIALRPLLRPPTVTASLVPRTFSAYMPRYAPIVLMAIPILSAGLVAPYASLRRDGPMVELPSLATFVAVVSGIAVISVVAGLGVLATLRRAQPFTDAHLVALDDASRAASLHALVGAAVTLELLLLASLFSFLQNAEALGELGRLGNLLTLGALFSVAMAVASWVILGHPRSGHVRRAVPSGREP